MSNILYFGRKPEAAIEEVEQALLGILIAHPDSLNDVREMVTAEMFGVVAFFETKS